MARSYTTARPEDRFAAVFHHLGAVTAYAKRRGCTDPDAIAAEAMAIAWRKLADVPEDDPLPWLYATARNLVYADWRNPARSTVPDSSAPDSAAPEPLDHELDGRLRAALLGLSLEDREALLLVAWEDLTPTQAAKAVGTTAVAFRVRLHRARRRCHGLLAAEQHASPACTATAEWEMS